MATVSSHTLNAVDGNHAGGIAVRLIDLATGQLVFETKMDDGGRRAQEEVTVSDSEARYELVFHTGAYWQGRVAGTHGAATVDEIAVRFTMPDPGWTLPYSIDPVASWLLSLEFYLAWLTG